MADMTTNLKILISAQNQTNAAFGQLNSSLDGLKRNVLGVVGALAGGLAFRDVIDATRTWGLEVHQLQIELGGTAEQMSALNFVAQSVGVTTEEVQQTFGLLAKKIADSLPDIEKGTSDFDKWGIKLKDSSGHVVGFDEALRRVKTRFQEVGQNAQGSALLLDIFSKKGKTLSDFLALTDPQMKTMIQDAQDFGLILGQDATDQIEVFNRQLYRFNLQMTGLKLQIGMAVLPLLSAMIEKIRQASGFFKSLGEAIGRMLGPFKEWIDKHGGVKAIGDALLTIGVALLGLAVLGGMLALLGWIGSLILAALPLAAVGAGLALIALAIKDIADAFNSGAGPLEVGIRVLGDLGAALVGLGAIMLVFNAPAAIVITALGLVFIAIKEVSDTVKLVSDNWDLFVLALKTNKLGDIPVFGALFSALKNLLEMIATAQAAIDRLTGHSTYDPGGNQREKEGPEKKPGYIPDVRLPTLPHLARGGIAMGPTAAMIGDAGPEAVIPLSRGGALGTTNVYITIEGSVLTENELAGKLSDVFLRQLFAQRNLSF